MNTDLTTNSSAWAGKLSMQLSDTQSALRACIGWVIELGISSEMQLYQQKNLALINTAAFAGLLLALPVTFVLMVMGFGHPFSLLISGITTCCLLLAFNGAGQVEWSKALFAFAPSTIVVGYTLLELPAAGLHEPLNYLLVRQMVGFALLLPIVTYGFESRQKVMGVLALCLLIFLCFDVVSMQRGALEGGAITGINHGLFTVLSLAQYVILAGCVLSVQNSIMQQARQTKQANEKYKNMAIHDSLTGLFNHGFMEQLMADAINRCKRSGEPLSLLMIDVDHFKQVNDTFGHNTGDEVLVKLAQALSGKKRSTDYLARWGGDELVLLLTDTQLEGAENLAEKLRSMVESQVFPQGRQLTISIGASQYQAGDKPANMVGRADAALYRAKRGGRNKVGLDTANR
jgi:diguanylate cyclase (GGDEF)-like protein